MKLSKEQLQLLVDSSPEPTVIYLIKKDQSALVPFLYSKDVPAFSGLTEEEYLALYKEGAEKVVVPQDLSSVMNTIRQLFMDKNPGSCTYRTYHKTKGPIWTHASFKWIGEYEDQEVIFGAFTDVSNQVAENTPGGFFIYAAEEDDQFYFVSENMLKMLGYTRDEFQTKFKNQFRYLVYQEDREAALQSIDEQIKENGQYDNVDYRIEKKDGSLLWVHDEGHYIVDQDGNAWFYVTINDMSHLLAENNKLQKENLELGSIISSIPVGIAVFTIRKEEVLQATSNEVFRKIFHVSAEQLKENQESYVVKNTHPEDADTLDQDIKKTLIPGRHHTAPFRYRIEEDKWQWIRVDTETIAMPDQTVMIYSVTTDLTGEKQAEDKLEKMHQSKLEVYQSSMQSLLFANPHSLCTVRMNLTQNTCEQWFGTSAYVINIIKSDSAEGVINNILKIILNDHDREIFLKHFRYSVLLEEYQNGIRNDSARYRRIKEDGSFIWVKTVMNMVENPETNDIEAVLFSEDISDQVLDEEIIQRGTDFGHDYIAIINVSQRMYQICYIGNQIPEKYMAYYQKFLQPKPYSEFVEQAQKYWYTQEEQLHFLLESKIENITSHLEKETEYTITLKSDLEGIGDAWKQIWFTWLDDSKNWIMIIQNDITDSVVEQQKQMNDRLNTERALRNEADKANESKSNFISNVSHDMRTPLNAILGYDRLALESDTKEQCIDYLKKINDAGETLLSLINDTLDLQRIETGVTTLNPKPVSCGTVVDGIVNAVKPMMDAKKIHFIFDNSKAVWATINVDEMRMEEIFINLLSNAAKFTPEGGEVRMEVECEKATETEIYDKVIVKDNGIGISKEFLPKLYEPFMQERTKETAGIGGSGLGLSIVKRLVDLMGGRIEVQSKLGEGTTFTVYLTLPKAADTKKEQNLSGRNDHDFLQGKKILLCEDNAMNNEIATAILKKSGMEVLTAWDGKEGAEEFIHSKPGEIAAVLMDIRMPIMDGYEAARNIRESSHPDAKKVPIIALSADAYATDIQKAQNSGMNNHLSKPINTEALLDMLAAEIEKSMKK